MSARASHRSSDGRRTERMRSGASAGGRRSGTNRSSGIAFIIVQRERNWRAALQLRDNRHLAPSIPRLLRPYELYVGLRYTRAKRRTHFISFISFISVLGIALGIWALISV